MAEAEGGRRVLAERWDENASAYTGNRGPGLADAKRLAIEAAAEYGRAELWVQHSDRLARGDGLTADHLAEVFFEMRRQGVRLRSVQDDTNLEDAVRAVVVGERNTEDSKRKAAAVTAGLRRNAERGEAPGGILADGYRVIRSIDDHGQVSRQIEYDPVRKEVYDLLWALALKGYSERAIAVELNDHGYRTAPRKRNHKSRPFDRNRVSQALSNSFYAGLSVHRGEVVGEGRWPRYVLPEDFHRLASERRERSNADQRRPGRPPEGYLLAGLARCGECGSAMRVETGRHRRKDGTYPRRYVCQAHAERNACGVKPIDAAVVDPAVIDNLSLQLADEETIRSTVTAARHAERDRLKQEARAAQVEAGRFAKGIEGMAEKIASYYADGTPARAETLEVALGTARAQRDAAETRLAASLDALTDLPEETPEEAASYWSRVRAELASRVDAARGDVKRLNLALGDTLDSVELLATSSSEVRLCVTVSGPAAARIWSDSRDSITPSPELQAIRTFDAGGESAHSLR
jgi:hypothetical protein